MSNRLSTAQFEAFVEFLEQNVPVARCYKRTLQGKEETKRKWAKVAIKLNSLGGVYKDGPGWAKYWAEKKCSLKRMCAQRAASMRETGADSNLEEQFVMSDLDQRLLAVMGDDWIKIAVSRDSGMNDPVIMVKTKMERSLSTSQNVESPMNHEDTSSDTSLPPPHTSRDDSKTFNLGPSRTSSSANPLRQPHHLISGNGDEDYGNMTGVEQRLLEAERVSAQAFADTSKRLDRIADATEHVAQAISEVARALHLIANNLAR